MADNDKTRQETVKDNIDAVEEKYGPENWNYVWTQLMKDINVSLAMLVDAGSSSGT